MGNSTPGTLGYLVRSSHRGLWSWYDDGIVSGRLLRRLQACDVCGAPTACVGVMGYDLPPQVPYTATIIHVKRWGQALAIYLGLGCGCLARFHRQVAHIKDTQTKIDEVQASKWRNT